MCCSCCGDDHDIGGQAEQLFRIPPPAGEIARVEAKVNAQVAAFDPAQLLQSLSQGGCISLRDGIAFNARHHHAEPPYAAILLRTGHEGPCNRRACEKADTVSPFHSITSLARARSVGGTESPMALAVLRLMTNSNFVGCSTGKSAAFSPLRIRPV